MRQSTFPKSPAQIGNSARYQLANQEFGRSRWAHGASAAAQKNERRGSKEDDSLRAFREFVGRHGPASTRAGRPTWLHYPHFRPEQNVACAAEGPGS
jgi:hypothetical protein